MDFLGRVAKTLKGLVKSLEDWFPQDSDCSDKSDDQIVTIGFMVHKEAQSLPCRVKLSLWILRLIRRTHLSPLRTGISLLVPPNHRLLLQGRGRDDDAGGLAVAVY